MKHFSSWLVAAVLALLPLQTVWLVRTVMIGGVKWHYGTLGLYAFEALALVAVLVAAAHSRCVRRALRATAAPGALLVGAIAAGALVAPDRALPLWYAALTALALAFGVTLATLAPHARRHITAAVLTGATVSAAIGVAQFLTQSAPASTLLGLAAHDTAFGGTATVTAATGRFLRAYGTFPHPNILGGYSALALLIALAALAHTPLRAQARRGALLASVAILAAALFATFSRSALLALALGTPALLWPLRAQWRRWSGGLVLIALVALVLAAAFPAVFLTRGAQTATPTFNAYTDRAQFARDAAALVRTHPLLGVGAGATTLAAARADDFARPTWGYQPAHTAPLLLLARHGALGTLVILGAGAALLLRLRSALRSRAEGWHKKTATIPAPLARALLLALAPPLLLDHWLLTTASGVFVLCSVIAIYTTRRQQSH